ncbi:zinc finger and SCAN domain-containing protein 2-like [Branchiostoma floridae]|uniref:Zinc finger and SCAN domain-containing protein 2-like n=1 Tax=Branchiostoma floridae TaxID=7739 RepID=A0A9J7HRJ9_BRAFL|nr:zinc finger and SCAN domain-containing protein 2-like [Branchiostoma floridae]
MDQETYGYQPNGHPWSEIYNSWEQPTDTGGQQDEERDVPNDETCGVKAEMEESSCELSTGELCSGHAAKEMGHSGKTTDRTEHPVKENNVSLDKHQRKHIGEKFYMCGECGYRTADRATLSRHMRTHIGEKRYKCDQCDYSAADKSKLGRHKRKHTENHLEPTSKKAHR